MIKCVVFDIGGTIYHVTDEDNKIGHESNLAMLSRLGYLVDSTIFTSAMKSGQEQREKAKGMLKPHDLSYRLIHFLGLPMSKKLAENLTKDFYAARLAATYKKSPDKNVKKIFTELRKRKIQVGILSNTDYSWARSWLHKYKMRVNPKLIVLSNEVGFRKPMKGIFNLFFYRIRKINPSIKREEILMVGDKDKDLAAKKAGFQTCWYNSKKRELPKEWKLKPDHTITNLYDLLKIVHKE